MAHALTDQYPNVPYRCLRRYSWHRILAWLAIWAVDLPPHGPAGRWAALLLAAVFFGASACGLYLIGMSLAMSGVEGAEAPAHPILYICKTIYGVAAIFTVVNLPFTLCLLIALGIKKLLG